MSPKGMVASPAVQERSGYGSVDRNGSAEVVSQVAEKTQGNLSNLLDIMKQSVTVLEDYLRTKNLPQPSFDENGPMKWEISAEDMPINLARLVLIEAANDMYKLALGPSDLLALRDGTAKWDVSAHRVINLCKIVDAVPLGGEASFAEISRKTGLNEEFVSRILRYVATDHMFREHRPGYISHTSLSAALLKNPMLRAMAIGNDTNVVGASAFVYEAIKKYPNMGSRHGDVSQTAFQVAERTDLNFFEYIERPGNEDRLKGFQGCMETEHDNGLSSAQLPLNPVWKSIPSGGTVVDIGGSHGHVSIALAKAHPHLRFIVEDREAVIKHNKTVVPSELAGRVKFLAHDMFLPQPIKKANIYHLRFIFHDWPDMPCVKILKRIVEAMEPGFSRIMICDAVLPESGALPQTIEKAQRAADLQVMAFLNAKERSLEDWTNLLHLADERLYIEDVWTPEGSMMMHSAITIGLKPYKEKSVL